MIKYNQLFKQQIVNFYFEHHENLAFILKHFNLPKQPLAVVMNLKRLLGTIMKNKSN